MKKNRHYLNAILCVALALCLMLSGCASWSTETEDTDSTDSESTDSESTDSESSSSALGDNPSIVTTSVAICEILAALEYDNVIGVPETEDDLGIYEGITTVGAPMTPDIEIIVQLDPDLVLTPQTLEASLADDYTTAGINSAFLDLSSVEGMYSAIASLGEILDREDQAQALIDEYESYIAEYESAVEGKSVLVLMCFPDGFYLVATEDSYVGNLLKLAGAENVYDSGTYEDYSGYMSINPEDLVLKNPDMIFVFAHYSEEAAFEYMRSEFETTESWQFFDAVLNDQIYYLSSDYFGTSANLEWMEALEYLQDILSGED